MKIAGIDYSMTCPCITVGDSTNFGFDTCTIFYLTDTIKYAGPFKNITGDMITCSKNNPIERFACIGAWAYHIVKDCEEILIEDYSMGSKGRVFHIAENTAILKYHLYRNNKKWDALPPTSLKKYATGKGNADKAMMFEAFKKDTHVNLRTSLNYTSKNVGSPLSDIVDSFYLAKYLSNNPLE